MTKDELLNKLKDIAIEYEITNNQIIGILLEISPGRDGSCLYEFDGEVMRHREGCHIVLIENDVNVKKYK